MIPSLAVMVGAYIVLRCIDLVLRADSHYSSRGAKGVVTLVAVLAAVVAVVQAYDIVQVGLETNRQMETMRDLFP